MPDGSSPPPDRANEYHPTACPGGRAPHLWFDLETGSPTSLYDKLGFEFTLLKLAGCQDENVEDFCHLAGNANIPLAVVELPGDEARELYGSNMALIRPDQVVAWRGDIVRDDVLVTLTGQTNNDS